MVCISTRILASKVVRENRLVQCNSGVVACAQKCAEGVKMNWSLFLLNQFLEDALFSQNWKPFSYSWLLILSALVSRMEPEDCQLMTIEAEKVCRGAIYHKLWWVEEPNR